MKTKTIQLIFLIIAGLIVGWREWTNATTLTSEAINPSNTQPLQEVGSATEASTVFIIFLLGTIIAFVINGLWQVSPKLSSPNSV